MMKALKWNLWDQLLVFQIIVVIQIEYPVGQALPDRCQYLITKNVVLQNICHTSINLETFVKTRSLISDVGEPVSLFIDNSFTTILVTIKESILHTCGQLVLMQKDEFNCTQEEEIGEDETIVKLKNSQIYCFPYHIYVADLVMDACDIQNEEFHKNLVKETTKGALQYTFPDKSTAENLQSTDILIVVTLSVYLYNQ
ncbi:hypothetical protein ACLKA6_012255 [Drosophila palustris]